MLKVCGETSGRIYSVPSSYQPHRDSNIANTNRPTATDRHPCYSMTSRTEYLYAHRKEITTIDANSPSAFAYA